jgi:1-acyl-sn-glycerol-3-phosphate acyltransferase
MKKVLAPIYFLYKLWIGAMFWLSLILLFPVFYILLSSPSTLRMALGLKRFWSWWLRVVLLCPVVSKGKSNFPKAPYIAVSNHMSYLDTVFMYAVVPDYFLFIGKAELLKWPFFSLFFKKQDIPVHRGNPREAHQSLQSASQALKRGECIALYPEGTIPDDAPKMKHFKNGAFKLAIDNQVPIVPITWHTNYKVMLDPSKFWEFSLPQIVRVTVHSPIFTSGMGDQDVVDLREQVWKTIHQAIENEN